MIDLSNYKKNIYQNYGFRECPFYGEDGVIEKIFSQIGVSELPTCVEFGELRVLGTTTRSFRIRYKSKSVYFSSSLDIKSFFLNILDILKVTFIKKSLGYLKFFFNLPFKEFATVNNIDEILQQHSVNKKNLDLLTVDIDSYDYYLVKEILSRGYRPKLFIVEYNPSFGLETSCTVPLKADLESNNKRIYGASFTALNSLFKKFEYKICFVTGFCNLFYIRKDFSDQFVSPRIEDEITDTNEKILDFIQKYCQTGFLPSWFNYPYPSKEEISKLDQV